MQASAPLPTTVDAYVAAYPPKIRAILRRVRATIRKAAPEAEERISYRMPCYVQRGALVYFGGFTEHVGLYPPVGDPELTRLAKPYAGEKGNLRFRYDEPIPYELITRIVHARIAANSARASRAATTKAQRSR